MDGWMDGWMGQIDRQIDRQIVRQIQIDDREFKWKFEGRTGLRI